jgi:hypothetical protein
MMRGEKHWRKIETHLREWAAELDKAKAEAEAEVANVQTQYYERLTDLRTEIERSLKRWDTELKELRQKTEMAETAATRGLEEFRARIQTEISDWQPEIDQLKARAATAKAEAKRLAQELRTKGTVARERLKRLKRTAGESWDEIKPAIEKALDELEPALRSAATKFREAHPQSPVPCPPTPRVDRVRGHQSNDSFSTESAGVGAQVRTSTRS